MKTRAMRRRQKTATNLESDATNTPHQQPLMYVVFKDGPWPGLAFNPNQLHFGQITAVIAHKDFVGYYAVPEPDDILRSWISRSDVAELLPYHSLQRILRTVGRKHLPLLPAWWVHEGFDWPPELLMERKQEVLKILNEWHAQAKKL